MIKAFLRKPGKSGARVVIVYKNIWIPTNIKIPVRAWDQAKQKVTPSFREHEQANAMLIQKKAELLDSIKKFNLLNIPFSQKAFKQFLKGGDVVKPKNEYTVVDLLRKYSFDHEKRKAPVYLRKYRAIANALEEYNPGTLANQFGLHQLNRFLDYLIEEKNLENNTLHDYVRKIRRVMTFYNDVDTHPDAREFKFRYIDPKPYWLDWDKVEILEKHKPKKGQLIYLQEFLFRCYTGLRWSDVNQLTKQNLIKRNGDFYLDFTVVKTRLDQNLLLSKKAVELVNAWKGKFPKLYMSDCNEKIKDICKDCNFNTMIQKVRFSGKERIVNLIPEYKMVTTHVARRTFGRRWMDKGGDIAKLSIYYGHSSISQTTKYIGYSAKEVNDELRSIMG